MFWLLIILLFRVVILSGVFCIEFVCCVVVIWIVLIDLLIFIVFLVVNVILLLIKIVEIVFVSRVGLKVFMIDFDYVVVNLCLKIK